VEAFIFFRTMVLDSAATDSWTGLLELADRVLVGLTESFEERLSGNTGPGPVSESPQLPENSAEIQGEQDPREPQEHSLLPN
jgi:hypothetical protein